MPVLAFFLYFCQFSTTFLGINTSWNPRQVKGLEAAARTARAARGISWSKLTRRGELFLPKEVLLGVVPACLLETYHFYQDMTEDAVLRGYPLNQKHEEEAFASMDHWLLVRLVKRHTSKHTGSTGLHAFVRKITKSPTGKTLAGPKLVDLLFAEEGSPGFVVAQVISRLENLSHCLAWSYDVDGAAGSSIDILELPRLRLSFEHKDGQLLSKDFKGMRLVTHAPPRVVQLMRGLPHSVPLQDRNDNYHILVPFVLTHRPDIESDPFSGELVLERENRVWSAHRVKVFLYEVHLSQTFLYTPTPTAALYLLLLKFQHRLYDEVARLVLSIATDSRYQDEPFHVFSHLQTVVDDQHPDACACKVKIGVVTGDADMQLPMRLDLEMALYVQKLHHVSASCRLTLEEEQRALQLINDHNERLRIALEHLESVPRRDWAEKVEDKKFLAAFQALLRSASLPVHMEDAKRLLVQSVNWKHLPPDMVATLSNRRSVLEALGKAPSSQVDLCQVELSLPARGTGPKSSRPGSVFQSKDTSFMTRSPDSIISELGHVGLPDRRKLKLNDAVAVAYGALHSEDAGREIFWMLYLLLFEHKYGVKVQLRNGQLCRHSHCFGSILFFLSSFSRAFGTQQSLLRLMIHNKELMENLPPLIAKKEREFHSQVWELSAACRRHLSELFWPRSVETFKCLTQKVEIVSVRPSGEGLGGVRPELRSGPLAKQLDRLVSWKPPRVSNALQGEIYLASRPSNLEHFSRSPLEGLEGGLERYVASVGAEHVKETLPFQLEKHPDMKSPLSQKALKRIKDEMQRFAEQHRDDRKQLLLFVDAAGDNRPPVPEETFDLRIALERLRAADVKEIERLTEHVLKEASSLDHPHERPAEEILRFWLLRYARQEAEAWFQFLCAVVCSNASLQNLLHLNPFLTSNQCESLVQQVAVLMLHTVRVIQINRALDQLQSLISAIKSPPSKAHAARIKEESFLLCQTLVAERCYMAGCEAGTKYALDPRLLSFEFSDKKLLRRRQVELVRDFSKSAEHDVSLVKQMIMGAGKTTVVSPLLGMLLADGRRLVVLMVPAPLLEFAKSVLNAVFSNIVLKRTFTFQMTRSDDIDCQLFKKISRLRDSGDLVLTVPMATKSLMLRFVESLLVLNDRKARQRTPQLRSNMVNLGQTLELLQESVVLIDEVDWVLHPLKSELNFPIGEKQPIDLAPLRWELPLHLLESCFLAAVSDIAPTKNATTLVELKQAIDRGFDQCFIMKEPHMVLLDEKFYQKEMKPPLLKWLNIFLNQKHTGRQFIGGADGQGLQSEEVLAFVGNTCNISSNYYLIPGKYRLTYQDTDVQIGGPYFARPGEGGDFFLSGLSRPTLQASSASHQWVMQRGSQKWILGRLEGEEAEVEAFFEAFVTPGDDECPVSLQWQLVKLKEEEGWKLRPDTQMEAKVATLEARMAGETQISAHDIKVLTLARDWINVILPHCLKKINRVTFGLMTDEQVNDALLENPLMSETRGKLGIPFIGKDMPSPAAEFQHPDVLVGLSFLSYRYQGLRKSDMADLLSTLSERYSREPGKPGQRASNKLFKAWVEASGGRIAGEPTDNAELPKFRQLHELELTNERQMEELHQLLHKTAAVVDWYLKNCIFPAFMRFQSQQLSASGEDLGGGILFKTRLGFSGTPSDLMPMELGSCDFEPGSEGECIHNLCTSEGWVRVRDIGWRGHVLLASHVFFLQPSGRCFYICFCNCLLILLPQILTQSPCSQQNHVRVPAAADVIF